MYNFIKPTLKDVLRLRVSKTLLVGGVAALADFVTLSLLVRVFEFSPSTANVPSLLIGSSIQFFGNRNYVFEASQNLFSRQVLFFASAELAAFLLNAGGFHLLIASTKVHYLLARPLVSALVFIGFSYPAWKWVFRSPLKVTSHKEISPC